MTGPCFVQKPAADVWSRDVFVWGSARILRLKVREGEGDLPSVEEWFEIAGPGQVWAARRPSLLPDGVGECVSHDVDPNVLLDGAVDSEEGHGDSGANAHDTHGVTPGARAGAAAIASEREDRVRRIVVDPRLDRWFHLAGGLTCGVMGALLGALDLSYALWAIAGALVATHAFGIARKALDARCPGPD